MRYFPLFLDLRARAVLVVGGGAIAARKIELLRAAGAAVTVVAPRLGAALAPLAARGELRHIAQPFQDGHVGGQWLVIAATDDPQVNRAAAEAAGRRGVFVNVVDDAEASSGIVPAIVDRSPLVIAISSGGTAPMLARLVRERLETLLDESLGTLATLLGRWRRAIATRFDAAAERRRFYSAVLQGDPARLVRAGRYAQAEQALQQMLEVADSGTPAGRVILVGAGPGDPGLLTLRGLRALQEADVVLHDRLVSAGILALVRRDAERISVGKQGGGASVEQQQIHDLLLEHAQRGRTVVRLKGGDPFIFGRGGEELEFLRAHAIPFEVVPGITAAIGAAAMAGIPLTHRGQAAAVRLLTAARGRDADATPWREHAASQDTLAIYMGLAQLETIGAELIRHGRPAQTPVALVENGTRGDQRVVHARLDGVAAAANSAALQSPVLLIVGEVAALGEQLHWFGQQARVA
jgi:uroporphyrin-III C-methyltransferase/precorrin-2 dehydrogenase/sirohydrochlorin ferrochelatase